MDLQKPAEAEKERRTRSKLEPHREAVLILRRKHWTYSQIAKWLNEHGISITLSSVHRFCERAIARRPRSVSSAEPWESETPSALRSTAPTKTQPKKYRFNLEI